MLFYAKKIFNTISFDFLFLFFYFLLGALLVFLKVLRYMYQALSVYQI
jgi:hypothetical protein